MDIEWQSTLIVHPYFPDPWGFSVQWPLCSSHVALNSRTRLTISLHLGRLQSLRFHSVREHIEYKLLSLTYKVLTTSQPDYLHNLISVQSTGRTRSSSLVTLARLSVSSSLQVTYRSFTYASPYLWNQLPSSFRQPHSVYCPPGSPAHITSSQSPPLLSSPITASTFHSRLF